jgi:hypothetical protein
MSIGAKVPRLCVGVVTLCLFSSPAVAAIVNATSCSSSAVQSAINAASTDDTVQVPAGACTWSTAVSIPGTKRITLRGAGMNSTVITRSGNTIVIDDGGRSGSRITGFEFVTGYIRVDGDDWRIDHNRFRNSQFASEGVWVRGDRPGAHPRGVVDHNEFIWTRVLVFGDANLAAHPLWSQPSPIGNVSGQKVFVEDNAFSSSGWSQVIDTNYGGRYVFRNNAVTNGYMEAHSLQHGRGARTWEIYKNAFIATIDQWTPMFIRGGTGVIYDNTLTTSGAGHWNQPSITLDNVRSLTPFDTGLHYGPCNGSSTADGNQEANGWPCRDQIGRGGDVSRSNPSNTTPSATGWAGQTSEPAYFWNNAVNGAPLGVYIHNRTGEWIQSGRDYFNNVQRPAYTPYPYPHPLVAEEGGAPPAPTGLTVR